MVKYYQDYYCTPVPLAFPLATSRQPPVVYIAIAGHRGELSCAALTLFFSYRLFSSRVSNHG